ncbi:MAG: EamA family transporter [Rhodospirillaceae bacterium]|nr:EamA family transporter [Rhodospirillaceae bacterium]
MLDLWILITLGAVAMQAIRAMMQKSLAPRYTVLGVTYARFLFAFPLAVLFVFAAVQSTNTPWPVPPPIFFVYAVIGGITQILGNVVFIHLIGFANFTISTTYSKTETVLAALFSFIVIGDVLNGLGFAGVLLTFVGVLVIAAGSQQLSVKSLILAVTDKAALYGLAVGALYAVASTSYRAGSLSLGGDGFVVQALYTLAWVSFFQWLLMGAWIGVTSPIVLHTIVRNWRSAIWLGITGVTASAGWYLAFALQKIPYVLAVGQVELVLAYLASHYMYKERAKPVEIAGILLTVAGILFVVFAK